MPDSTSPIKYHSVEELQKMPGEELAALVDQLPTERTRSYKLQYETPFDLLPGQAVNLSVSFPWGGEPYASLGTDGLGESAATDARTCPPE